MKLNDVHWSTAPEIVCNQYQSFFLNKKEKLRAKLKALQPRSPLPPLEAAVALCKSSNWLEPSEA